MDVLWTDFRVDRGVWQRGVPATGFGYTHCSCFKINVLLISLFVDFIDKKKPKMVFKLIILANMSDKGADDNCCWRQIWYIKTKYWYCVKNAAALNWLLCLSVLTLSWYVEITDRQAVVGNIKRAVAWHSLGSNFAAPSPSCFCSGSRFIPFGGALSFKSSLRRRFTIRRNSCRESKLLRLCLTQASWWCPLETLLSAEMSFRA